MKATFSYVHGNDICRLAHRHPGLGEAPEPPECDDPGMDETPVSAGLFYPDDPKAAPKWPAHSDGHGSVGHVLCGHRVRSPRRVRPLVP